jgi:hypothetical protein
MAAELTDHIWGLEELLAYRVPPPKDSNQFHGLEGQHPLTLESGPAFVYGEDCPAPSAGRLSLLFGPCCGQQRTCGFGLRLGRCGDTHMLPRSRLRAVVTFMAWQAPCPWL